MKPLLRIYFLGLFFSRLFYTAMSAAVLLFISGFFFPALGRLPMLFFLTVAALTVLDYFLLMSVKKPVHARRATTERLSNGDENPVDLFIENLYAFAVRASIIDEIPFQFQKRDVNFQVRLNSYEEKHIRYHMRPLRRGEYSFGHIQVFLRSPIGLVVRQHRAGEPIVLPVYPSFLQMRRYELMAISNRLSEIGIKKIRRVGHSMEFDQVKPYVQGDDYRSVNWKATARRDDLMVNAYTDERSQQVYCVIDKSRSMQSPFEGLTLLDYAINASLVLSNVAMIKQDKAGLITIADRQPTIVPADRGPKQLNRILRILYKERTRFPELNSELLFLSVKKALRQRSLVVFFTHFESLGALQRQMPFLQAISRQHLLMVIFFENTELRKLTDTPAANTEGIYIKTIAEKMAYEKRLMVKELARHGILSVLTPPQKLTINTVNKYLELKARQKV